MTVMKEISKYLQEKESKRKHMQKRHSAYKKQKISVSQFTKKHRCWKTTEFNGNRV